MARKRKQEDNIVTISKEVQIPGTDYVLEKGDKIEVLKESFFSSEDMYDWAKVLMNRVDQGEEAYAVGSAFIKELNSYIPENDKYNEMLMGMKRAFDDII